MREELQEKTPAERTDIGIGYDFDEWPWLQLMCCTPVSGHEMVMYFRVEESHQREGPKKVN